MIMCIYIYIYLGTHKTLHRVFGDHMLTCKHPAFNGRQLNGPWCHQGVSCHRMITKEMLNHTAPGKVVKNTEFSTFSIYQE